MGKTRSKDWPREGGEGDPLVCGGEFRRLWKKQLLCPEKRGGPASLGWEKGRHEGVVGSRKDRRTGWVSKAVAMGKGSTERPSGNWERWISDGGRDKTRSRGEKGGGGGGGGGGLGGGGGGGGLWLGGGGGWWDISKKWWKRNACSARKREILQGNPTFLKTGKICLKYRCGGKRYLRGLGWGKETQCSRYMSALLGSTSEESGKLSRLNQGEEGGSSGKTKRIYEKGKTTSPVNENEKEADS